MDGTVPPVALFLFAGLMDVAAMIRSDAYGWKRHRTKPRFAIVIKFRMGCSPHHELGMQGTCRLDAFQDVDHVARRHTKCIQPGNHFCQ